MILYDFLCSSCGNVFEALVLSHFQDSETCSKCGGKASRLMPAPKVGTMHDPLVKAEALKKRSFEHSVKEARKDPEKLASKLKAKPKVQNPWNLRKK